MTLSEIRERAIPPALALLPARMSSREAEIKAGDNPELDYALVMGTPASELAGVVR